MSDNNQESLHAFHVSFWISAGRSGGADVEATDIADAVEKCIDLMFNRYARKVHKSQIIYVHCMDSSFQTRFTDQEPKISNN